MCPSTKLENHLIKIIDDAFRLDKNKKTSRQVFFENDNKLVMNLTNSSLKKIPIGYSKRIYIHQKSNLTLEKIFGDCFWGAKHPAGPPLAQASSSYSPTLQPKKCLKKFVAPMIG